MHLFLYSLASSLHLSLELPTLSSFHAFEDRKVLNYSVCAEYVIFLIKTQIRIYFLFLLSSVI